jgi:membrane-associated protease RseP (regulator of RpoE activity)
MVSIETALAVIAAVWVGAFLVKSLLDLRRRGGETAEQAKTGLSISLYPLLLIVRTRSVAGPLDRLAQKAPRFWDAVSRAAVATGFGLMAFAIYFLSTNLATYLFRPEQVSGENIVIPLVVGVTIRLDHLPYLFIAFAIVLITHEGLHGVIARREQLPVKSAGIFLVFVVPGGFVEPDEQAFKAAPPGARMRVAAVGSFANLVVGFLTVLAIFGLFVPVEAGLIVVQTEPGSKIAVNEVLVEIDGVPVNSYTVRSEKVTIGQTLRVRTLSGEYVFQTNPEVWGRELILWDVVRGLGIEVDYFFPLRLQFLDPAASYALYRTLHWLQLVSFGVAVFNMLPIHILDGSIVLKALLERYIKNPRKIFGIANAVAVLCLALLISNIAFSYSFFGFFQI